MPRDEVEEDLETRRVVFQSHELNDQQNRASVSVENLVTAFDILFRRQTNGLVLI